MVDRTSGNSCFMLVPYPSSGTILRVGFNNLKNTAYFLIGNPAWQSLEFGKQYQLAGRFDDGALAYWTGNTIRLGNTIFLMVHFNSPSPNEILTVFGQRLNLKLYYRGTVIANLKLNGTAAAAAETINCNNQFVASRPDPFGGGKRPVVDPFTS